ncbi:hypothetical protein HDU77_004297 [Chytriomyces hyalinus]|nr:hypothetical protein HDU77_004297 [Chytriomyces hyalinus]
MSPSLPTTELSATSKPEFYAAVKAQIAAVIDPTLTQTANLANVSSVLFYALTDAPVSRKINWCGFYLTEKTAETSAKRRMVLGPFQGRVACTVIPFGRGVCGTAAATAETVVVADVHSFKGHIACDSASESEIVVPILTKDASGSVVVEGVLDIDCLEQNGFDAEDKEGLEAIVAVIADIFKA